MSTQKKRRHNARVYEVAIRSTFKSASKGHRPILKDRMGILVLKAPAGYPADEYGNSIISNLFPDDFRRNDFSFMYIRPDDKPSKVLDSYREDCQNKLCSIIVVEDGASVPTVVQAAADAIIDLPPISRRDLRIACRATLGLRITDDQAAQLLAYPLTYLWAALRPRRTFEQVLERLTRLPTDPGEALSEKEDKLPALADMHGYGAAKSWGIELTQDLSDWRKGTIAWSEVDRGIVLSGPPGVGKTVFAKALAKQCGVNLIATSLGQWQATGHLGDLLKAMRRDFSRAKERAPSIIFIDEIDSVGDRNTFTHDNANYSVQVVNALLENLDGLDGREGVVVVAATNNISRIDPAILRSGRLDRHVEISLPTGEDRIAILAQHIERCVPVDQLTSLKIATAGMSGADLAKVARDAKRRARRERRPVSIDDLKASMPEIVQISGDHRHAIAIHEAGHTVVGIHLHYGRYVATKIADHVRIDSSRQQGGAAYFDLPPVARRDRRFYLNFVAVMLAGLAAEELCLGDVGDGAGGGENSDLAVATRVATLMETRMGMGATFVYSNAEGDEALEKLRLANPRLQHRIEIILSEQYQRAKGILEQNKELLQLCAKSLNNYGQLVPEDITKLKAELTAEDRRSQSRSQAGRRRRARQRL